MMGIKYHKIVFYWIVLITFLVLCSKLFVTVIMGGLLALVIDPIVERLQLRKPLRLFVFCLGLLVLIFVPFILLTGIAASKAFQQLDDLKGFLLQGDSAALKDILQYSRKLEKFFSPWLNVFAHYAHQEASTAISSAMVETLRGGGVLLGKFISTVASEIPDFLVETIIMLVSFYFALLDGKNCVLFFSKLSPLEPAETQMFIRQIALLGRSVVGASIMSGIAQGVLAVCACALLKIDQLALIGVSIFLSSFVPVVGSLPVMVGLALYGLAYLGFAQGMLLLVVGIILLGSDSLVRPWFLKGTSNLHPYLAFISALGGLYTVGFFGLFLGPLLAGILVQSLLLYARDLDQLRQKSG